jgi:chromosome segregation ATPase
MSGANETKNDLSQTAERLILQMEQFTYTIHQYGDSTNKLESKINACTNSIGRIEQHLNAIAHRTDNMEDQLGSMNQRLNDMEEKMESLDLKLKTLDGYLYEIVKREKDMMKEFCDFRRT